MRINLGNDPALEGRMKYRKTANICYKEGTLLSGTTYGLHENGFMFSP